MHVLTELFQLKIVGTDYCRACHSSAMRTAHPHVEPSLYYTSVMQFGYVCITRTSFFSQYCAGIVC